MQKWTHEHISGIVDILEQPQQKIGKEQNYEQLDKGQLVRLLAEQAQTIADLRAALIKKKSSAALSILHGDLPEAQREVLQAILDLPEDAFEQASLLITTLKGKRMTEAFAKSFASVMTRKGWAVACGKCAKPAAVYWSAGQRYAEGGRAQFSHAGKNGSDKRGSLSTIPVLQFLKKIDRRRSVK